MAFRYCLLMLVVAVAFTMLSAGIVFLICSDCGVPSNQVNGRCE